jgi:hypothetical protein
MDLEALKLKLLYCLNRAEVADRDDLRQQWLSAAETWQSAIEFRARIQYLTAEWATIKNIAAGKADPRSGDGRRGTSGSQSGGP